MAPQKRVLQLLGRNLQDRRRPPGSPQPASQLHCGQPREPRTLLRGLVAVVIVPPGGPHHSAVAVVHPELLQEKVRQPELPVHGVGQAVGTAVAHRGVQRVKPRAGLHHLRHRRVALSRLWPEQNVALLLLRVGQLHRPNLGSKATAKELLFTDLSRSFQDLATLVGGAEPLAPRAMVLLTALAGGGQRGGCVGAGGKPVVKLLRVGLLGLLHDLLQVPPGVVGLHVQQHRHQGIHGGVQVLFLDVLHVLNRSWGSAGASHGGAGARGRHYFCFSFLLSLALGFLAWNPPWEGFDRRESVG
eukprot:RCo052152